MAMNEKQYIQFILEVKLQKCSLGHINASFTDNLFFMNRKILWKYVALSLSS